MFKGIGHISSNRLVSGNRERKKANVNKQTNKEAKKNNPTKPNQEHGQNK